VPEAVTARGYAASTIGVRSEWSGAIDALFEDYHRPGTPGLNLAVLKDGEVIHRRGYGVASVEHDLPFHADTLLHLGSTSKHICAAALLLLEREGRVSLDDDVRIHVPELPDYGEPVTLRHLASMTSGMADGFSLMLMAGVDARAPMTRDHILRLQCRQAGLMFRPGSRLVYSNTNYNLLSLVIERAVGETLAEVLEARIFRPLGMDRTRLMPWMSCIAPDHAPGHAAQDDGGYAQAVFGIELCGDGGIASTLTDMIEWYGSVRSGALLGDDLLRMVTPTLLTSGHAVPYGLGLEVSGAGLYRRISHAGGMPGHVCDFAHYPEADLGIVLLANLGDPSILRKAEGIAEIILDPAPRSGRKGSLPAGLFVCRENARLLHIDPAFEEDMDCTLMGVTVALEPEGGGFRSRKRTMPFSLEAGGEGLVLTGPDGAVSHFVPAVSDTPPDLSAYCGRYRSDVLQVVWNIALDGGMLAVSLEGAFGSLLWRSLEPVAPDLFAGRIDGAPTLAHVSLQFMRDADGITGFSCNLDRAFGVLFERLAHAGVAR